MVSTVLVTNWPTGIVRSCLHSTSSGLAEDLWMPAGGRVWTGHSAVYMLVFPYLGACNRTDGRCTRLLDANHVLFVSANENYRETQPIAGIGHASPLMTSSSVVLEEIVGSRRALNQTFGVICRPSSAGARVAVQALLAQRQSAGRCSLEGAETIAVLLRSACRSGSARWTTAASPPVERAKQFLHAHKTVRVSLEEIASAVGVSGAYLTSAFSAREGMSLCRYHLGLRLARIARTASLP